MYIRTHTHNIYALFTVVAIPAKCCVLISIEDTIKEACGKMDLHFYLFSSLLFFSSSSSCSSIGSRVLYSSLPKLLWAAQNRHFIKYMHTVCRQSIRIVFVPVTCTQSHSLPRHIPHIALACLEYIYSRHMYEAHNIVILILKTQRQKGIE